MSDTRLFPEPGSDGSYALKAEVAGIPFTFTVSEDCIRQEVIDQCDVKKPARKAILRASMKRLSKVKKQGLPKEGTQTRLSLDWDAFVVLVDKALADRHVAIRENPAIIDEIVQDPIFLP